MTADLPTPVDPAEPPEDVDRALFLVHLARRARRDPHLLEASLAAPTRRRLLELGGSGERRDVLRVPIERWDAPSVDRLLSSHVPVVVEGGCRAAEAAGWTLDDVDRVMGDQGCALRAPECTSRRGTVREVLDRLREGRADGLYVDNTSDIAVNVPDFDRLVGLRALMPLVPPAWRLIGTQVFLGGPGTGSNFHCADNTTLFLNLQGTKRWTLVHRNESAWMYAFPTTSGIYYNSAVREDDPEVMARYPLYGGTTRLEAELGPGDVLYLPRWWWHAVRNEGAMSFGCSVRLGAPIHERLPAQNLPYVLSNLVLPSEALRAYMKGATVTDELFRDHYYDELLDLITVDREARRSLPEFTRDPQAGAPDPARIAAELALPGGERDPVLDALDGLTRWEEANQGASVLREIPYYKTARHAARWQPDGSSRGAERLVRDFLRL